ncbi:MAG: heavy-metal-associated domain-containing protein [Clostridia bacterium]|nr:heavy-metal-associated domain-containing protein [Clostridia bacterium]
MVKFTLFIEGMRCKMCEAHMNEALTNDLGVKKVTSSHEKNETVMIADNDIEDQSIRDVVNKVGFELKDIKREPYEKKGIKSK